MGARAWEDRVEQDLFADPVVMRAQSPYQHLTITSREGDTRLFLDGGLQFSTVDEYRYHESLVHPVMASTARHDRILVLGGGDGLAVREVLKWADVGEVVLVDLDPLVTEPVRRPTRARGAERPQPDEPAGHRRERRRVPVAPGQSRAGSTW